MERFQGIAVGGPRHGVKLDAAPSWDGRIAIPRQDPSSEKRRFYPGKYIWGYSFSHGDTWCWKADDRPTK